MGFLLAGVWSIRPGVLNVRLKPGPNGELDDIHLRLLVMLTGRTRGRHSPADAPDKGRTRSGGIATGMGQGRRDALVLAPEMEVERDEVLLSFHIRSGMHPLCIRSTPDRSKKTYEVFEIS